MMGAARAYAWWFTPNPVFGDIEPVVVARLHFDSEKRVYNFIAKQYEDGKFVGLL